MMAPLSSRILICSNRATALNRPLFSQDSDLLSEAKRRQLEGRVFPGVIFSPQQALSIRQFIEELEIIAKAGEPEDFANRAQYLPLR
jgi:hypothetical protein